MQPPARGVFWFHGRHVPLGWGEVEPVAVAVSLELMEGVCLQPHSTLQLFPLGMFSLSPPFGKYLLKLQGRGVAFAK